MFVAFPEPAPRLARLIVWARAVVHYFFVWARAVVHYLLAAVHVCWCECASVRACPCAVPQLDPTFVRGYHRAGNALLHTKDLKTGIALVEKGLVHSPGNSDLVPLLEQVGALPTSLQSPFAGGNLAPLPRPCHLGCWVCCSATGLVGRGNGVYP